VEVLSPLLAASPPALGPWSHIVRTASPTKISASVRVRSVTGGNSSCTVECGDSMAAATSVPNTLADAPTSRV
jgi:hypothetical protein